MGLTIEEMDLAPDVAAKAHRLKFLCPGVVFTSGRRTLAQQAHAMAENVALKRAYIRETYRPSPAITQLQGWVDRHPEAHSVQEIAAGLLGVLAGLSEVLQNSVSRHLTGRAFDILPGSCPVSVIEQLNPRKVLTHEASLPRLHVEF